MIAVAGGSVGSCEAGVWCSSNDALVVLGLAFSDSAAWISWVGRGPIASSRDSFVEGALMDGLEWPCQCS